MTNKPIIIILGSALFTLIGLAGGYMAAFQKSGGGGGHDEKEKIAKEDHTGHDHGDEHGHEDSPTLSTHALKNLKVETQEVELTEFSTYRAITARVKATPKTILPIFAPISGVVKTIDVEHGEMVKKGIVLITLMRDAIPRPELKITGSLLDPEQRMKGLSAEDISKFEKQSSGEKQAFVWKSTLKRYGYWTEESEKILENLPENIKVLPLVIALLGEISANGYLDVEFVQWILADKEAAKKFLYVTSYILEGKSISFIKNMISLGAFESIVTVKVPNLAPDFDVHSITVKPGDHVEEGQSMGELHNMRELHIESHARGTEIEVLMNALEEDLSISATPLAKGSGVALHDLKIRSILDDIEESGATVHLEIDKNPFVVKKSRGNNSFRSWKIRIGTRYLIRVPQEKFEEVYVLPSHAVVEESAEKLVFIQDGDTYKSVRVVVLYQNDEVAVLSKDSEIFAGDPVVVRGAFALGLALKAQTGGGVDAHAGHGH